MTVKHPQRESMNCLTAIYILGLPTNNFTPIHFQVTLKIDEKEVDYALQDKTLLSSILQEGMPTASKK